MRDDMLAINAAGYAVNPMSVGNVKQTVTRKETKISTMVESAQDVLDPVVPPVKPGTPNTAPTAVNFASTGTPTAESLTVGQVVGSISCVDYAPTGAQNNCSYAGGDAQFGIASITGQVVIKNANLSAGTYTFPTRATDANGLSIDGTAKVTILPAAVTPNTAPSAVNFAPGAVLIAERLAV